MLDRPFYQPTIAFLTVLMLVGGIAVLLASGGSPGIEIVPAVHNVQIASATDASNSAPSDSPLLNINTATAAELDESLPGIGPVLAERIVAYRQQNGPFARADQLMQVGGIGQTTYENLQSLVTVGD